MWLYTCALGLLLSAPLVYAEFTGRVRSVISNPTIYLLFTAGTFFYTYHMLIVAVTAFLISTTTLGGESQPDRMDVL